MLTRMIWSNGKVIRKGGMRLSSTHTIFRETGSSHRSPSVCAAIPMTVGEGSYKSRLMEIVLACWASQHWLEKKAEIDPMRPWWQRQQARSLGICSMHDDRCYVAELYLILRIFNKIRRGRARSITLLNARARSSGILSVRSNTC